MQFNFCFRVKNNAVLQYAISNNDSINEIVLGSHFHISIWRTGKFLKLSIWTIIDDNENNNLYD